MSAPRYSAGGITVEIRPDSDPTHCGVFGVFISTPARDLDRFQKSAANKNFFDAWVELAQMPYTPGNELKALNLAIKTLNAYAVEIGYQSEFPAIDGVRAPVCECGGTKAKTTHSAWCPVCP